MWGKVGHWGGSGVCANIMFRGHSHLALDGKGRLAVPARYRDLLLAQCAGHLIVTLDPSACLLLYPFPEWEPIERKLNALPSFNPVSRQMQRVLVGSATDVELDSAGRILLPAHLRERIGLDKEAVLVGQGNKFEIWSAEAWTALYATAHELPNQLASAMQTGDIPDDLRNFSL